MKGPTGVKYVCYSPYYSGAEQETLRALATGFGGAEVLATLPRVAEEAPEIARAAGVAGGSLVVRVTEGELGVFARELLARSCSEDVGLLVASNLKGALLAALARTAGGPPWLWYVHDYLDHRGGLRSAMASVLLHHAAGVLANSHDVAACVASLAGGKPPPVVYCMVRPLPEDARTPRTRLSAQEAVLYVGSINAWKGLREIVDGLVELRRSRGRAPELHVAGQVVEADYWANVQQKAAGGGIVLKYLGVRRDAPVLMTGYEVLLHGTLEREPFGLVVAEGVQAGCFVVSTGLGGVREILPPAMLEACYRASVPAGLAAILAGLDARIKAWGRERAGRAAQEAGERFGPERYQQAMRAFADGVARGLGLRGFREPMAEVIL